MGIKPTTTFVKPLKNIKSTATSCKTLLYFCLNMSGND